MLPLLLSLALLQPPQATDPCAPRKAAASVDAWVVTAPVAARDTVVRAIVCLRQGAGVKVGSYHGLLVFDSTAARVMAVQKPQDGMRVENTKIGGRVNFAGANPQGFTPGVLLRVTLRVARPGQAPALKLEMREINSVAGTSLLQPPRAPTS